MTDPTPEACNLARRIRNELGGEPFLSLKEAAEEIDALTEQRVAAAAAKAEKVIQAARSFCGESANCLPCRNREAAIAAYDAADRPAPEGAIPIPTYGLDAVGSGPSLARDQPGDNK